MTTNPDKSGQNSGVDKDVSKLSRKGSNEDERLWLDELNQKNIDDFIAETNLKMEILPVCELSAALHNFVDKGDNMAFFSCIENKLEETRERIKQSDLKPSDAQHFTSSDVSEKTRKTNISGADCDTSFSDDEGAKLGVNDIAASSDDGEPVHGKRRKRAAPTGRKRAAAIRRKRAAAMCFSSFFKFRISI